MHQKNASTSALQGAKSEGKTWTAPTLTVALLAKITESNPGGSYGDGTIFTATS